MSVYQKDFLRIPALLSRAGRDEVGDGERELAHGRAARVWARRRASRTVRGGGTRGATSRSARTRVASHDAAARWPCQLAAAVGPGPGGGRDPPPERGGTRVTMMRVRRLTATAPMIRLGRWPSVWPTSSVDLPADKWGPPGISY